MAAKPRNRARPWADLPEGLIDAVVDHLDFFSASRLAGVCTSWARAVAANASLPFGAPCLLMTTPEDYDPEVNTSDSGEHDDEDKECAFQLLEHSRGKELSFPAPIDAMRGRWWVGGKDDWLATVDEHCNAELVNPYTGCRIGLPPLTTIPGVVKTEETCFLLFDDDESRGHTFCRIVVCETPSAGNAYVVVAIVNVFFLAITRAGDERWTPLETPWDPMRLSVEYKDVVLHKGRIFAIGWSGDVYAWDTRAGASCPEPDPEPIRPPHIDYDKYQGCRWNLAESADGRRLLLVCVPYDRSDSEDAVYLYERDVDADGAGWSLVTTLGDHSLFLGANYPFLARVVSPDDGRELLRPNCIYHTMSYLFDCPVAEYSFDVFDLEKKTYKPYREFYVNHDGTYQTPLWFRPTLKNYPRAS